MSRNPEYQLFLDYTNGKVKDLLPKDEETTATSQEIGWWKKHQIEKAIRAARYGLATPTQLHLLKKHDIAVSDAAKHRTRTLSRK